MTSLFLILLYFSGLTYSAASAEHYYAADSNVIGSVELYTVKKGDSLVEIAPKFRIGYNAISEANPNVDPFMPPADLTVRIPMMWIIPDVPVRKGIVRDTSVEILQGLTPGEKVVTAGHYALKDGAEVRLSLKEKR